MKKFLSLVLALVMALSLVTVVGAKDFTDDADIVYKEAADVISTIGVIEGYSDGSFRPEGELTRQAAAKIICNLILGPTTAKALPTNANPFPDVATGSEFAGYIAYCAEQGIISGYADGTFKPGDPLSGYAFLKMLLGALGYDQEIEHYVGPNWRVNVAKQAIGIGLDDNLIDADGNEIDVDGSKVVTRGEAVLYAFNTLQADMVEYDSKTTVNVGGATVTVGSDTANALTWKNSATKKGNIKDDNYIQFAEQFFPDLKKDVTTDDFARPSTKWTWKGEKVGTFADKAAVRYSKNVALGDIYADLGMNQADDPAEVYINGQRVKDVKVSKNNKTKIASDDANKGLVGDGSIVEVFYDTDNNANDVTICVINVYPGEVTSVDKKASDPFINVAYYGDGVPKYTSAGATDGNVTWKAKFETDESFSEDDVVFFTWSQPAGEIQDVYKAESVSGTLNQYVSGKSIDINGTTYKYNLNIAFLNSGSESDLRTKSDYIVYLDENGYAIYVDEEEFKADDYAFVLAAESSSTGAFTKDQAKIVDAKGKVRTVSTDDDYTDLRGQIVTYRADSNGEYALRAAPNSWFNGVAGKAAYDAAASTSAANAIVGTNKASARASVDGAVGSATEVATGGYTINAATTTNNFDMRNSRSKIVTGNGDTVYANSETVFVVHTLDSSNKHEYTAYEGIVNAPTITRRGTTSTVEMFYYVRGNNLLAFVFIDAAGCDVTDGSNSVVLLAAKQGRSDKITNSDNKEYYEVNAVVNNEITTVKVLATQDTGSGYNPSDKTQNYAFQNPSYDSKGFLKKLSDFSGSNKYEIVTGTSGESYLKGIWKLSGRYTIGLGGTKSADSVRYTVASDAKIFYVDTDGNITRATISDVYSDAADCAVAIMDTDSGDIAYLMIQEVDQETKENASGNSSLTGISKTGFGTYAYTYAGSEPDIEAVRNALLASLGKTGRSSTVSNVSPTSMDVTVDGITYTVALTRVSAASFTSASKTYGTPTLKDASGNTVSAVQASTSYTVEVSTIATGWEVGTITATRGATTTAASFSPLAAGTTNAAGVYSATFTTDASADVANGLTISVAYKKVESDITVSGTGNATVAWVDGNGNSQTGFTDIPYGTTVTVTASDNGLGEVKSVAAATTAGGTSVTLTETGTNVYTFTMPAEDVTVTVTAGATELALSGTTLSDSAADGSAITGVDLSSAITGGEGTITYAAKNATNENLLTTLGLSISGSTLSGAIPAGTAAGDYAVVIKATDETEPTPKSVEFTVTITVTASAT